MNTQLLFLNNLFIFYIPIFPTICAINSICSSVLTFFMFSTLSLPPKPSNGTYPYDSSNSNFPYLSNACSYCLLSRQSLTYSESVKSSQKNLHPFYKISNSPLRYLIIPKYSFFSHVITSPNAVIIIGIDSFPLKYVSLISS